MVIRHFDSALTSDFPFIERCRFSYGHVFGKIGPTQHLAKVFIKILYVRKYLSKYYTRTDATVN